MSFNGTGKVTVGEDEEEEDEECEYDYFSTSVEKGEEVANTHKSVEEIKEQTNETKEKEETKIEESNYSKSQIDDCKGEEGKKKYRDGNTFWHNDENETNSKHATDGNQLIGDALLKSFLPAISHALSRIEELSESQQHLLVSLKEQKTNLLECPHLADIERVMLQVPSYIDKCSYINETVLGMTTQMDILMRKTDLLQTQAHSRAIALEEKRDVKNQWNKLYAAKEDSSTFQHGEKK